MKLSDKIWVCRKKAGLSQEALAERIGVSRQAISKWETGEASPEITKLPLLAREFGVTADWLLDDSADFEEDIPADEPTPDEPASATTYPGWLDHLPGWIVRAIRKYGWLYGVRMAVSGAVFTLMGFVARAMFGAMGGMMDLPGSFGGAVFYDSAGNQVSASQFGLTASDLNALGLGGGFDFAVSTAQPFEILCNFIIFLGLAMLIGGLVLAWYLKKKGQSA